MWHLSRLMKFQIINSSPSNKCGEHWLLLCADDVGKRIGIFVWDCPGRPLSYYGQFHRRLLKLYGALEEVEVINPPLQKLRSNLRGLYFLYLVHYLDKKPFINFKLNQNHLLMQTTKIDVVRFFNENVKKLAFGYKICWNLQSFREFSVILWRLCFEHNKASYRVLGSIFNVTIFSSIRSFPVFFYCPDFCCSSRLRNVLLHWIPSQ